MMNYFNYFGDGGGYMMSNWQGSFGGMLWFPGLMLGLIVWSLVWKGLALWKSAQKGDRNWFIALLVLNTMGILDILYIYVLSDKKNK